MVVQQIKDNFSTTVDVNSIYNIPSLIFNHDDLGTPLPIGKGSLPIENLSGSIDIQRKGSFILFIIFIFSR